MPRHRVARPHSVAHAIHIHHTALAVLDVGVELLLTQPTPELQPWKSLCLQHSLASPEGAQCCTVHQPGHDVILEFATDVSVSSKHNLSDLLWDGHPRCLQLRCLQSVGQHLYVAHLLQQCAPIFLVGIVQHSVKQPPQMIYTRMTGFSVTIHPWINFYPGVHVPPLTVTIHPWIKVHMRRRRGSPGLNLALDGPTPTHRLAPDRRPQPNIAPNKVGFRAAGRQSPPSTHAAAAHTGAPWASISPWTVPHPPRDSPQTARLGPTPLPAKPIFSTHQLYEKCTIFSFFACFSANTASIFDLIGSV